MRMMLTTICLLFSSLPPAHLVPILGPQACCIASPATEGEDNDDGDEDHVDNDGEDEDDVNGGV